MALATQSIQWKPRKQGGTGQALLLVHGIGNAAAGDYTFLLPHVKAALGAKAENVAVYSLYYDAINDWFKTKTDLEAAIGSLKKWLGAQYGGIVANVAAEVVADVFWPILSSSAREAIQTAYLAQLQRLVLDGIDAGFPPDYQKISIVCHSLGCFHTYEALHRCVNDASQHLHPVADGVRFKSVVFMASPVQMIRTVADAISFFVHDGLAVLKKEGLSGPVALTPSGTPVSLVEKWVSLTGALDPVGGHLFRHKLDWAYMNVPARNGFKGQDSKIDAQDWLNVQTEAELRDCLMSVLSTRQAGQIPLNDPHSWGDYIKRHTAELEGLLCV